MPESSILYLILVICPQCPMMVAPVFFIVGVNRQCCPTQDREEQANTSCCQAEQDANPHCNRHTEKHPKQTGLIMALVDVTQSRHDAEHRCDFILPMLRFFAEWCMIITSSLPLTVTIQAVSNSPR